MFVYGSCEYYANIIRYIAVIALSPLQALPFPVAARSNAWVCSRSLAGIVGLNPARNLNVCCACLCRSGRGTRWFKYDRD